jgi:hypothetical protein
MWFFNDKKQLKSAETNGYNSVGTRADIRDLDNVGLKYEDVKSDLEFTKDIMNRYSQRFDDHLCKFYEEVYSTKNIGELINKRIMNAIINR